MTRGSGFGLIAAGAAIAAAAAWLVGRKRPRRIAAELLQTIGVADPVDEASRDSFPASDPPFCELNVRLELVGLAQDGSYDLRLTQEELSECLGITSVHANRTLQELRSSELLEFASRRVAIRDWGGLQRLAEFDPAYLYLDRRQR